jgi:hypothetical protein
LIALIATLATTTFSGTASAHERRAEERHGEYGRYLEQEHHEPRERQLREHQERARQAAGWWIGRRQ